MARILVVDDAAFMRKMVSDALTRGGHEVVGEAGNGVEAITRFQELKPELKAHEKIEEQCLYGPIARDGASDPALSEWVSDRHQDEVHEVEGLIKETERLDPEDETWLATVRQIKSALENHIRQEEQNIFPRIGRIWDRTRLEEAGREMSQGKAEKAGRRG